MSKRFDPALLPPAPDLQWEKALWAAGVEQVAGIDEAGRGALAGPVYVGAVTLPARGEVDNALQGLRDSKQLTVSERESWFERIQDVALTWGVGSARPEEIDFVGIVPAIRLAAGRALVELEDEPAHLLLDYLLLPDCPLPQTSLIKGDERSLSIACASVLAKVTRDEELRQMDREYPGYQLAANKGYGTAAHRAAIDSLGPCPIHRKSFSPMKQGTFAF